MKLTSVGVWCDPSVGARPEPIPDFNRPVWQHDALCRGKGGLFFASDPLSSAIAAALCRRCPVRGECAALAVELEADGVECWGVWAGKATRMKLTSWRRQGRGVNGQRPT